MSATVLVNGRTVIHAESEGVSTASPDWCVMPSGAVVPLVNTAFSKDIANCATTVFADGHPVATSESYIATSTGNEAAVGGVVSGKTCGKASFINHSYDVFIEGKPVPRNYDPMVHNHGSPPNAMSPGIVQPNLDAQTIADALCVVFCQCNNRGNTYCAQQVLAEERWINGHRYWDPWQPQIWVEVPYDMSPWGGPEPMLSSSQTSKRPPFHRLAAPELWPIAGSRRPDVTITRDTSKPLSRKNILRIAEFKFNGDTFSRGQKKAYEKIDPTGVTIEIDRDHCVCAGEKTRHRVPVREVQPEEAPQLRRQRVEEKQQQEEEQDEPAPEQPVPIRTYAEVAFLLAAAAIIILDPVVGDEPALVPIMTRLGTLLKAV